MIPYPSDPRSYNRYSYVRNNPLKYVDPSGHFGFVKNLANAVNTGWKSVKHAAKRALRHKVIGPIVTYLISTIPYVGPFLAGYANAWAHGADYKNSMRAGAKYAVIYAISAKASDTIGNYYEGKEFVGSEIARATTHATFQAAVAKARGQNVRAAFISSFVSSYAMHNAPDFIANSYEGGLVYSMVIGGTVSEINGGQFGNGATSAAFIYMYNKASHEISKHDKFANPTGNGIRKCDAYGCGNYGASRGNRLHNGTDYISVAGEDVYAPISGEIYSIGDPYKHANKHHGKFDSIYIINKKYYVKVYYVSPSINIGDYVSAGQKIGVSQDLSIAYPPTRNGSMTNHIHIGIHSLPSWGSKNPEDLIPIK
jgi:murein DD-endopeptidase MepM/ murein hydrolase activator NlpD